MRGRARMIERKKCLECQADLQTHWMLHPRVEYGPGRKLTPVRRSTATAMQTPMIHPMAIQ